jgi:sulfotransferase family protein
MLRVVGAGLPRTGTKSLKEALELLLGGRCYHMAEVLDHLEEVDVWAAALRGDEPDWETWPPDCVAAVDWPASVFWRELADAHPHAVILLSTRESATQWWESCDATILPIARKNDWPEHEDWLALFHGMLEREIGENWDDQGAAEAYYERYNAAVRRDAPPDRLLEFRATDGWEPLCAALGLPVPEEPFPRTNTRAEWNA